MKLLRFCCGGDDYASYDGDRRGKRPHYMSGDFQNPKGPTPWQEQSNARASGTPRSGWADDSRNPAAPPDYAKENRKHRPDVFQPPRGSSHQPNPFHRSSRDWDGGRGHDAVPPSRAGAAGNVHQMPGQAAPGLRNPKAVPNNPLANSGMWGAGGNNYVGQLNNINGVGWNPKPAMNPAVGLKFPDHATQWGDAAQAPGAGKKGKGKEGAAGGGNNNNNNNNNGGGGGGGGKGGKNGGGNGQSSNVQPSGAEIMNYNITVHKHFISPKGGEGCDKGNYLHFNI